jgi:2-hydroxychromene-2-carboxylate isomerase
VPSQIDFWFSIGSTYSYLSVMRIDEVARRAGGAFRWRPFDVRAIMVEMNNIPFHTKPAKLRYMWRDVERRAGLYRLPWSAVPPYPIKHLSLVNRIALSAAEEGWCADYVKAAYQNWFISGQDPSIEPNLSDNLRAIGQNADKVIARATSDEAKVALEAATTTASALGIFGSPTFVTNGEIFWGDDRLEDAISWYKHGCVRFSAEVSDGMELRDFPEPDSIGG